MDSVSKHTQGGDAATPAAPWMDTQAVLGWVLLLDEDECEVVWLTEAGQAALAQAQAEDAELPDPFGD